MKVYRYMSIDEFYNVTAGIPLESYGKFLNCRTNSEGFCFLPEQIQFYSGTLDETVTFDPIDCFSFLAGVVSCKSVLVEFETEETLQQTFGIYADPYSCDWGSTICIDELCTKSYDRTTFIPKRYCFPEDHAWYDVN